MNIQRCFILLAMLLATPAIAQHADIQFSYENDEIVVRNGIEGFTDGFQIYEGTFPVRGFSERFTENPGFLAEIANDDMILPGDEIEIELLESSTFGSYLTYYDPTTDSMAATDATITIEDNMGTNTIDLEIGNLGLDGDNPQFIQTADGFSEVHAHIDFSLSSEAELGAYGILFRMRTNNSDYADSQPVWLVFNFGMSPFDFGEMAIPAFVGSDILLGDTNGDGLVNLLDIELFVNAITTGEFLASADINQDGVVNLLDISPFIELLTN